MRLLRALSGALLWILASVVGLVGAILCVTIIGLPIGIFLLRRAGRTFSTAVRLMLPSSLAHPVEEMKKSARDKGEKGADRTKETAGKAKQAPGKVTKKVKKKAKKRKSLERRLGL
jgi:hypothetical protein